MRAMTNYYNMPISDDKETNNGNDNLAFLHESDGRLHTLTPHPSDDYYSQFSGSNGTMGRGNDLALRGRLGIDGNHYEYAQFGTIGSSSARTYASTMSEMDYEKRDELGSTSHLMPLKVKSTCSTFFGHLETAICTISLAANFGNLYRLPQTIFSSGDEVPFLVVYTILSIFIGFPLLFLELGIGQLAQEGFVKMWRAVPFFKGVGYVKLVATCLLMMYYPLYIALCLYYSTWILKGPLPFTECAVVRLKEETGYSADGIPGEQCLKKTFLESPFTSPKWYLIYIGILFLVWTLLVVLSVRKTKSFVKSLLILFFPTFGCLIALIVHSAMIENSEEGLQKLTNNVDWSVLGSAHVWYYAAVQVFFSTNVGFGTFVTNANAIYNKVNPFWVALVYTLLNLLIGIGCTIFLCAFSSDLDLSINRNSSVETHLLSLVYDSALKNADENTISGWAATLYLLFVFSGLISMVSVVYTILKVFEIETKQVMSWWQACIILGVVSCLLGSALLLYPQFRLVHLLDHYIVGNLILISVVIEVLAFIIFYGINRMQLDFEFIIGRRLTKMWYVLWWFVPLVLFAFFIWALVTIPSNGMLDEDPVWMYGVGFGVLLVALVFILAIGFYTVYQQDEYFTLADKLTASLKPVRKWGPVDPILRYNWVHWHSKAKEGQRDFTLKRRGTKDYTHSVKKYSKPQPKSYTQTSSELSATLGDKNQNNIRLSNGSSTYAEPYQENGASYYNMQPQQLRVTSLVDSFEPVYGDLNSDRIRYKTSLNPLAKPNLHVDLGNSEEYGTFRRGPYVITDELGHVCHRRYSHMEEATEL